MSTPSRAMQALERAKGQAPKPVPTVPNENSPIPESIPVTRPASTTLSGKEEPTQKTPPQQQVEEYNFDDNPTPPTAEPPTDKVASSPDADIDDIDKIIDIKGTSAENMKRLRTKLKGTAGELNSLKTQYAELQKKVQDYESGVVVPEQLQNLQDRIDELERFERIYKLESSPAYRQSVLEPLETTKNKLLGLASEYGVETSILERALSAENVRELNGILNQAFPDEIGALEAKSLINEFKTIQGKAKTYREDASGALARLNQETEARLAQQRQAELEVLKSVSKNAWADSLIALRQEDHVALTFKDGDSQHNENIARPILNKASRDFGSVVKALGENGLKQLPPEIAHVIARSIQLAHESAILKHQFDALTEENTLLKRRVGDLDTLNRPGFRPGGGNNGGGYAREKGAIGAARASLAKVTSGR